MERKESKAYRETSNKSSKLKLEIMKKTILVLGVVLLGFNMQSKAQGILNKTEDNLSNKHVIVSKTEDMQLMAAINRDFPELVFKDKTVIPMKDLKTQDEGYSMLIKGEKRTISANYDRNFELKGAIVYRKNIAPNPEIRNALFAAYPDWMIAKNSYRAIYKEDGERVERFKFTLTKGEEKLIVHTDIHGNFLKPPKTKKV